MALEEYESFAPDPLTFPIRGKHYTPPPVSAKVGIALVRVLAGDTSLAEKDSRSLWEMLLGPVFDEMVEDGVPLDALARAGFAMLVDWQGDRSAAEAVWKSGIDPEARAALAAAGHTKMLTDLTQSLSTASASGTRSPAYSRPMTSQQGTRRGKPRKAAGKSAGKRSSNRGG